MERQTQEKVREYIRTDAVNKNINPEKQAWHDRNSDDYREGRSYLLPGVDPQELVNKYHGTGHTPITDKGWNGKEVARRTGTHVVPTGRSD